MKTSYRNVSGALHTDRSLYGAPFPAKFETTNTYMGTLNLTAAVAGAYATQVFRANSVYDPDQTNTGTTAVGYAALSALYTNYYVKWCTIKIKCINQVNTPIIVTLIPSYASNVFTNLIQAKSTPYYKEVVLDTNGSGGNIKTMESMAWSHKVLDLAYKEKDLIADIGTNPTKTWFWLIGYVSADATQSAGFTLDYEIFYRTVWTGRRPIVV